MLGDDTRPESVVDAAAADREITAGVDEQTRSLVAPDIAPLHLAQAAAVDMDSGFAALPEGAVADDRSAPWEISTPEYPFPQISQSSTSPPAFR